MVSRTYWKDKRIALVGLGAHGEMVEDAKFLIKSGALLSVYDLKSEARLKTHLTSLRSIGLANYVCGFIPVEDLLDMDLIILSHEYPRESSFLAKVAEKGIPIEYPETLFFKLAPPVTVVGVIGPCGKTTVMSMLRPLIESVCVSARERTLNKPVCFVSDVESDEGILVHLKDMKNGDILLMRMTGLVMKELHHMRISPHVAVFTGVPFKTSFERSAFEILDYQTYNNFLVSTDSVIDSTRSCSPKPRAKMLRVKPSIIPAKWGFAGRDHEKVSAALALETARIFKVQDEVAEKVIGSWKSLKGHLEFVKKIRGNVEFYNDAASVLPDSTLTGLSELSEKKNLILIIGGCYNGCDYSGVAKAIPEYAHTIVLLPGSGTMRERQTLCHIPDVHILSAPSLEEAVRLSRDHAKSGDKVLFSPGFAAGGMDVSRKERGEKFVRAVKAL